MEVKVFVPVFRRQGGRGSSLALARKASERSERTASSFNLRNTRIRVIVATCALVVGGCDAPEVSRPPKPHFHETVSKLAIARLGGRLAPVFWLDDRRAMLAAGVGSSADTAIYIWDVNANTYSKYADLNPRAYIFYYNRGQIVYSPKNGGGGSEDIAWMVGPMGGETRQVLDDRSFNSSPMVQLALGPRIDTRYRRTEGTSSLVYHLNHGDGMILVRTNAGPEVVMQGGEEHATLVRADDASAVDLPILGRELGYATHISYSVYLEKYVLLPGWHRTQVNPGTSGFLPGDPRPVYLLSRHGGVETRKIPAGPWAPSDAFPSKAGLFWVSSQAKGDERDAGGWLLRDDKVIKVFDYLADAASLSPNGCTLVFAVNTFQADQDHAVRAVDLCSDVS